MPISSISIKNYMPFKEASIEFNPISVFLGANSSGKSSIVKLLLLLSQSFDYSWAYEANKPFRSIGDHAEFGDPRSLFRGLRTKDRLITIKIDVTPGHDSPTEISDTDDLPTRTTQAHAIDLRHLSAEIHQQLSIKDKDRASRDYRRYKHLDKKEIILEEIKLIRHYRKVISKLIEADSGEAFKERYEGLKRIRPSSFIDAHSIYETINPIAEFSVEYQFYYSTTKDQIHIKNISLIENNKETISVSLWNSKSNRAKCTISSDVIDSRILQRCEKDFKDNVYTRGLFPHWKSAKSPYSPTTYARGLLHFINPSSGLLFKKLALAIREIAINLSPHKVHHVVPVRAYPKRYYSRTDSHTSVIGGISDPDFVANTLRENVDLRRDINRWMEIFDVKIDIKELNAILLALKVKHLGVELDLTDVGFGISQVLPIIVKVVSAKKDEWIMIEQPEIHLHPMAQAKLADFFIEMAKEGRRLIIETHSEAFLRRLRRRMAESELDSIGPAISPKDVAILFFERQTAAPKAITIRKADISLTGSFEWPKSFKAPEIDDTIAFMKHQRRNV